MAILAAEERANGRGICRYQYAGRDYRTSRPSTLSCPMTPNGSMVVLTGTEAGN
jgi:hypothetical protein